MSAIAYRNARPDDEGYVFKTWLSIMLTGKENTSSEVLGDTRKEGFEQRIKRLLERSTVRVAYDASCDTSLLGFAVFEGDVGHFRYVRNDLRKQFGIAKGLLGEHIIRVCTHRGQGHAPGRMSQTYNPFLLEK